MLAAPPAPSRNSLFRHVPVTAPITCGSGVLSCLASHDPVTPASRLHSPRGVEVSDLPQPSSGPGCSAAAPGFDVAVVRCPRLGFALGCLLAPRGADGLSRVLLGLQTFIENFRIGPARTQTPRATTRAAPTEEGGGFRALSPASWPVDPARRCGATHPRPQVYIITTVRRLPSHVLAYQRLAPGLAPVVSPRPRQ